MRILRTSRNAADCLFSTIPKGLRIGCFSLRMSLSHFGAKDGRLHCILTFVCAQHDTNTCQFSNAKSGIMAFPSGRTLLQWGRRGLGENVSTDGKVKLCMFRELQRQRTASEDFRCVFLTEE